VDSFPRRLNQRVRARSNTVISPSSQAIQATDQKRSALCSGFRKKKNVPDPKQTRPGCSFPAHWCAHPWVLRGPRNSSLFGLNLKFSARRNFDMRSKWTRGKTDLGLHRLHAWAEALRPPRRWVGSSEPHASACFCRERGNIPPGLLRRPPPTPPGTITILLSRPGFFYFPP